jgi:hypothetical protein
MTGALTSFAAWTVLICGAIGDFLDHPWLGLGAGIGIVLITVGVLGAPRK